MITTRFNKTAGQSIIEYCLTIGVFVAAAVAMSALLQGHIQGNWRQNADSFSDEQYEEGKSTGSYNLSISDSRIRIKEGDVSYSKSFDSDLGSYVWKK